MKENFPPVKKVKFYIDGKESGVKACGSYKTVEILTGYEIMRIDGREPFELRPIKFQGDSAGTRKGRCLLNGAIPRSSVQLQ